MGKEEEIRKLLQQGYSAKHIIEQMGFQKSTVYKVQNTIQTFTNAVTRPDWSVENIGTNRGIFDDYNPRFMPGEQIVLNYNFVNNSTQQMYVRNLGIQTEWMIREGSWWSQPVGEVLRPGQRKHITLSFNVPNNLPFGEYEIYFGGEQQFVPVQGYAGQLQTQWSNPLILHIQHPFTGQVAFLSHSIQDNHLVAELEKQLNNYGIKVLIGEDDHRPGADLETKFQQMIRSSTIFVALLTEPAAKSEWVLKETNFALGINKPCILLKEESLTDIRTGREWTPFSLHAGPTAIFQTLMSAIQKLEQQHRNSAGSAAAAVIGIGLLALLLGLGSGRR